MDDILVSIVIATFNSEKVLPLTLEAIKKQNFARERLEILIVDGGSTDQTLSIAKEYNCIVLQNPKTEPINAKIIGIRNARGKYLISIDHDEVMESPNSIQSKVNLIEKHPECKVILCSGYKRPDHYPLLNQYISEFGDPYSLFMYHFSKDCHFMEKVLKQHYVIAEENEEHIIVEFQKGFQKQPIMEVCCAGTLINREYFIHFDNIFEHSGDFVHLFYLMLEDGCNKIGYIKGDPLVHYSVDSLKAYLPKLKWRVCNNVHFDDMGACGFRGRQKYQSKMKYKKYFFILYCIFILPPLFHSAYLAISRKNAAYLLHTFLCWYVLLQIALQYMIKIFRINPKLKSYDGKKVIK